MRGLAHVAENFKMEIFEARFCDLLQLLCRQPEHLGQVLSTFWMVSYAGQIGLRGFGPNRSGLSRSQ